MRTKTKMILFDAGQTLLDFRSSMAEVVSRSLLRDGIRLAKAQQELVEPLMWSHSVRLQAERGTRTSVAESWAFWAAVYEGMALDLGLPDPARHAVHLMEAFASPDAWEPFADVHSTLTRLRSVGLSLGVVSNWSVALHGILTGLDLHDYFDFVITSAEVGVEKPDPAIFGPAMEAAGVCASECLYVGDSLTHDLPSSMAAGLDFALIDRAGRHHHAPCARLASLHDLARLAERAS